VDVNLLSRLCCPNDYGQLVLRNTGSGPGYPTDGELQCSVCSRAYPIEAGIPRFLTEQRNELCPLQESEMRLRNQAYRAGNSRRLDAWHAPELDAVRAALGDCRGLSLLDAGCGVGNFTRIFKNAENYLGVDLSWEGLVHFQRPSCGTVGLVQGDVTRMPVRGHVFDVALSCQVLSHIPTADLRSRLLDELARVLKPDGRLILTAMHYNFRYRRKLIPQEAEENGSFYHRFEVPELRELLSERFTIHSLHGYWIYLPKTYRLFMALGSWRAYWDRIWRKLPLSLTYGKYLLAVCSPKT
jgi:SAM-dependent methyltransferase